MEYEEDGRNADWEHRKENQSHQVAGKHVGIKTNTEREDSRKMGEDLNREYKPGHPPDGTGKMLEVTNYALLFNSVEVVINEGGQGETKGHHDRGCGRSKARDEADEIVDQNE